MELLCRYNILLFPKERAEKTHLGYCAAQSVLMPAQTRVIAYYNLLMLYETGIKF